MEKQQEQKTEQEELKDIISSREDGFGCRLKKARELNNLSTLDVARELRLDERIILALENEDRNRLPASAFVCGYIRNYAKFMHLQPEPLVEDYKKELSDDGLDPQLKITKGKAISKGIDLSRLIVPLAVIFVVVIVILGGWFIWGILSVNDAENTTQQAVETIEIPAVQPETIQNESDPESLALPVPKESDYIQAEDTAVDNTPEPDEAVNPVEPVVQNDTINVPVEVPAEPLTEADIMPAEVTTVPPVTEEAAAEMAADDNQLILEFSGNSWIVIKDADNNKLSQGLKKAGEIIRLQGKAPYHIFLGDARVVTVSIHGKIFDHAHYINDKNIARFDVE